jgi:hypothetical protein
MIPKVVSWSPSTIGGVNIWLDGTDPAGNGVKPANGTTITRWADKSGSSNHATTGVGAPKFYNNVIRFDGASYFSLPNGAIPFGDSSYTFFYVATFYSGTTTGGIFFGGAGNSSSAIASRPGGDKIFTYWWNNDIVSTGTYPQSSKFLYSSRYQTRGSRSAFMSGYPNGGSDTPSAPRTQPNTGNRIGASFGTEYLKGSISEFIMFNKSLTDVERERVEGYLAWKWGLQDQLPPTHEFSVNNNTVKYKVMPTQEVYSVGDYIFTKANAQSMCTALGGDLATSADLVKAQTNKAQWCSAGWLKDTTDPRFPTQVASTGCGVSGVNSHTPTNNLAAANCIGVKPAKNDYGNTTFTDPTTNITGTIKSFNIDRTPGVPEMWSQNTIGDLKTCAAGSLPKSCPKSSGVNEIICVETGKECTGQGACGAGQQSRSGVCVNNSDITASLDTTANAVGGTDVGFECSCVTESDDMWFSTREDKGFPNAQTSYQCPAGSEMRFKFDDSNAANGKTECLTMHQYMARTCSTFDEYIFDIIENTCVTKDAYCRNRGQAGRGNKRGNNNDCLSYAEECNRVENTDMVREYAWNGQSCELVAEWS